MATDTSRPTVSQLDSGLGEVINWERFATHLPGIEQSDIQTIKRNNPFDVQRQKLALFDKWLRVSPKASWDGVILALEKADEITLADMLKGRGGLPDHYDLSTLFEYRLASLKAAILECISEGRRILKALYELHRDGILTRLRTAKIIPYVPRNNHSFDWIMKYFKAGLEQQKTGEDVVAHCKAFLKTFEEEGGPMACAADEVRKKIETKVKHELGIVITLS